MEGAKTLRWLSALPVSRRAILAALALPPLTLGTGIMLARPGGLAVALAMVVVTLALLCIELAWLKGGGLSRQSKLLLAPSRLAIWIAPIGAGVLDFRHRRTSGWTGYTTEFLAAQLAQLSPAGRTVLFALVAVALAALYGLAQRQFDQADFVVDQGTQSGLDGK
jgi:hypothetical protein